MNKRVLLIAFHYPPCGVSSGLQRTLAFTKYLKQNGWDPALVTVKPSAYQEVATGQLKDVPADMPISRSFAPDATRHFSVAGRYPGFLAIPDRWSLWRFTGTRAAMRLAKSFKPDVIWSTYPIPTSHVIAARVAAKLKLPWVADMRDPMVEYDEVSKQHFPTNRLLREARLEIENTVMRDAARVVFCTDGARNIFETRYSEECRDILRIIPNGFDEETFSRVEQSVSRGKTSSTMTILHSGTVYPGTDRGPDEFFRAIRELYDLKRLPPTFKVVFRASGHDDYLRELAQESGIEKLVELKPALPYESALEEMLTTDVLLLLQGRTSNPAIPAKAYEYLRAGRPILALVDKDGDTHALFDRLNAAVCAPLDDKEEIKRKTAYLLEQIENGEIQVIDKASAIEFSRESHAVKLARVLDEAIGN